MEIIGRISKGSRMDQVYIPKNRAGLDIGSYVVIKPAKTEKIIEKPHFYNVDGIEPIKITIIKEIMSIIDSNFEEYENIIITGSFLDKGFHFNDIDIILISEFKREIKNLSGILESKLGIKTHILLLDNKTLMKGLSTDPLYQTMLSNCVSKKRFIYNFKRKVNYKLLDVHLFKSKILIDNFDNLNGNKKYYLIRNAVAIFLYMQNKDVGRKDIDRKIEKLFDVSIEEIKQNVLNHDEFIKKYKSFHEKTFDMILEKIKEGSK